MRLSERIKKLERGANKEPRFLVISGPPWRYIIRNNKETLISKLDEKLEEFKARIIEIDKYIPMTNFYLIMDEDDVVA